MKKRREEREKEKRGRKGAVALREKKPCSKKKKVGDIQTCL